MIWETEDIISINKNPVVPLRICRTYTDIKSGRSIGSPPGFQSLMVDCEAGRIDLNYTCFHLLPFPNMTEKNFPFPILIMLFPEDNVIILASKTFSLLINTAP